MSGQDASSRGWTRGQALRATLGGAGVAAVATRLAGRDRSSASAAGPSAVTDVEILNVFLLLEEAQLAFYTQALRGRAITGELRTFAQTVAEQERGHVAFLRRRLGGHARPQPRTDFSEVTGAPESFRKAAVDLEEAAVAAYVGQGANLTRGLLPPVAGMVAVEARQAAWIRDLAGENPAPRAADPPRTSEDVLADLRRRGWLA